MVLVIVETEVRPTEDIEKVKKALSTIIVFNDNIEVEELSGGYRILRVKCSDLKCLKPLRDTIRIQQVEPAVKSYLYKYMEEDKVSIMLHKQAAYVGKISLIDNSKESPLGPIRIDIEGSEEEVYNAVQYLTREE